MDKYTILVVDDIKENIDVLVGTLKKEYKVIFATSGQKALDIVKTQSIDLILLDIMMPEMDGFEVCKQLKKTKETAEIPIIFVTADHEVIDEAKGFELGAVDYIHKPIKPVIVKARVKSQLILAHTQKELSRLVALRTSELQNLNMEIFKILGRAGEYKDNETGAHVRRMSQYSYHIGLAYGMEEEEARRLEIIAALHDLGKIGIPEHILLKPGKLDKDEWNVMKRHAQIGSQIIGKQANQLLKDAAMIMKQHHERWDGTGYPKGLRGDDIHIYARIVALSDVFDALLSKRPYKDAWSLRKTKEYILNQSGIHFDPKVVNAFDKVSDKLYRIRENESGAKRDENKR